MSKKSHIHALRALELYNISVENYSEAGKCVEEAIVRILREEGDEINGDKIKEVIRKIADARRKIESLPKGKKRVDAVKALDPSDSKVVEMIQMIRLPTLNGINHFCHDRMWECGVQMHQLISDILDLNMTDKAIVDCMKRSCATEGRFFSEYFFIETTMDGEDEGKFVVKMKPSEKLSGCIEAVRNRWPRCYIHNVDGSQKPEGRLVVEIHPCSPSKLDPSFAEANDLPTGVWVSEEKNGKQFKLLPSFFNSLFYFTFIIILLFIGTHSKGDENTNVNVFLYSTQVKDYEEKPQKETGSSEVIAPKEKPKKGSENVKNNSKHLTIFRSF